MAFELKQSLKLSQQLVMTPQLQQAIKLLQLNRQELVELINQELVENPILEETGDSAELQQSEATGDEGPEVEGEAGENSESQELAADAGGEVTGEIVDVQSGSESADLGDSVETRDDRGQDEPDWEAVLDGLSAPGSTSSSMREALDDLPSFENALTRSSTLEEHLRWQLSMVVLQPAEQLLAQLILGNLNDDGYLKAALEDLAREAGMELEDAEEVLKLIQAFDPPGVAARDLRECLLAQAKLLDPRVPQLDQLISEHLSDVERRAYAQIAKAMAIDHERVGDLTKMIALMEPRPGRSFHAGDTHYITPDIYVAKVGNEYVISLNDDGLPRLKISPYYRELIRKDPAKLQAQKDAGDVAGIAENKTTRDYVSDKLRAALWLIRSIHNRQRTIFKVTEAIVARQKDFFEKGVQFLKPMILKDVAQDIGMHESTVSRVTTNKYVHTPVGIFELKYFFNSSIPASDGGDSLASEAVKDKMRRLLEKEDPRNPLSDQEIAETLEKDGIHIARRTVAKYRDLLGVLSSSKRKKVFR